MHLQRLQVFLPLSSGAELNNLQKQNSNKSSDNRTTTPFRVLARFPACTELTRILAKYHPALLIVTGALTQQCNCGTVQKTKRPIAPLLLSYCSPIAPLLLPYSYPIAPLLLPYCSPIAPLLLSYCSPIATH